MKNVISIAVLAAGLSLSLTAGAAIKVYSINLNGAQEVPSNPSPAVASAQFTVDDTAGTITFALTAFNLQGAFANAHIHGPALPGQNAGVVFGLTGTNADYSGPVVIGSVIVPNSWALQGSNKPTTWAAAINATPWLFYANLHTTSSPGGEIRGQLAPVPEASTLAMMLGGLSLVGLAAARRRKA